MSIATSRGQADLRRAADGSIKEALQQIEELLVIDPDRGPDAAFFATLGNEFRFLHARIRTQHAADCLRTPDGPQLLPTERIEEWDRLCEEHAHILGMTDWLIRNVDSIPDQGTEDKDVFILRVKELLAVLRRHDAEEDRLYALAFWKDTGGES